MRLVHGQEDFLHQRVELFVLADPEIEKSEHVREKVHEARHDVSGDNMAALFPFSPVVGVLRLVSDAERAVNGRVMRRCVAMDRYSGDHGCLGYGLEGNAE